MLKRCSKEKAMGTLHFWLSLRLKRSAKRIARALVHYAVCLYTDGMNPKAIAAKLADGWTYNSGLSGSDLRIPYVGTGAFIYKYHPIPAGP